jgi:hypothetical protein
MKTIKKKYKTLLLFLIDIKENFIMKKKLLRKSDISFYKVNLLHYLALKTN